MSTEYASFDDKGPLKFDLHEIWDEEEAARKGGVKTATGSYTVTGDQNLFFDCNKSGYIVTVERVLGVDGWEKITKREDGEENNRQRMSLMILKIVVMRDARGGRVASVTAKLSLENQKKGPAANPEVEAWAPFRKLRLTHEVVAKLSQKDRTGGRGGFVSHGADVALEKSRETEIDFEQTYYDSAYATPHMNRDTKQRGGVTWFMEQSKVGDNSAPPETYVALMFSRSSDAPYVVRFEIDVRAGTVFDLNNKVMRAFRIMPGRTKPFLVTPSTEPKVRGGEGRDFLQAVQQEQENLGNLRARDDSTGLNLVRKSGEPLAAQEGMRQVPGLATKGGRPEVAEDEEGDDGQEDLVKPDEEEGDGDEGILCGDKL